VNAVTNEKETTSIQTYARMAGLLFLLSMIGGGFGEFYVPTKLIVAGDATATANNIVAFNSLFRWGFAGYLLEAVCDISLAWIMYVLLRPVQKDIALLAAFFGLVSTAVFAVAELFFIWWHAIPGILRHSDGYPWISDLSIGLLSEVSRRSSSARRARLYSEEFRRGPGSGIPIRPVHGGYAVRGNSADALVPRQGGRRCKMGSESGDRMTHGGPSNILMKVQDKPIHFVRGEEREKPC